MTRYLSKSRFKLAEECPAKLFYTGKRREYADNSLEDEFLQSLAEGGFQVGELAKCYYPGGVEIDTLDAVEAVKQTNALLRRDTVTILEAAIQVDNFFIRTDILRKNGSDLELIEVKAKSFDAKEWDNGLFLNKSGKIDTAMRPYLEDAAFQKYVLSLAFPEAQIQTFLMLADKTATATTSGLNQKFRVINNNGRKSCYISSPLTPEDCNNHILAAVPVDNIIELIYQENNVPENPICPAWETDFRERAHFFAEYYGRDEKISCRISNQCKSCQFDAAPEDIARGLKSGKCECFKQQLRWQDADFADPSIFEVWNFRDKEKLLAENRVKIKDMLPGDFNLKPDENGMSRGERQLLQVNKVKNNDNTLTCLNDQLKAEMDSWVYPLHFIDFETSMAAIPFTAGRRPYEGVAFQFSHHILHEDGRVEHAGEFLEATPGVFPNYLFIDKLMEQLSNDNGSIFRYSNHENTFLNTIFDQLDADSTVATADRERWQTFIKSITHKIANKKLFRQGERDMIDQWKMVKLYYYDPLTHGSNSLKAVLPATLNRSEFLKATYRQPISAINVSSLNFPPDHLWLKTKPDGEVLNPYKQLPRLLPEVSSGEEDALCQLEEVNNGGAALTVYGKLQFEDMTVTERRRLENALKRYCELDTLAMVMLHQAWQNL